MAVRTAARFAVDVFAGGQRRQRHLGVQVVGRADVDDIDPGVIEHFTPVGGGTRKSQRRGRLLRALRRCVGEHCALDLVGGTECGGH